jgi:hypothetical protein
LLSIPTLAVILVSLSCSSFSSFIFRPISMNTVLLGFQLAHLKPFSPIDCWHFLQVLELCHPNNFICSSSWCHLRNCRFLSASLTFLWLNHKL